MIISASAVTFELNLLKGADQNISQSWMFKGAYAIYEGQIDSLSIPCNLSAEIQVINTNDSFVQIRTSSTIATTFMPSATDHTIQWINKTNINFQPIGETLANTYDTQVSAGGIGIRNCIAYEYINELINATYYVDKIIYWSVKITYATIFENQTYVMEFNLKNTNIDELKLR